MPGLILPSGATGGGTGDSSPRPDGKAASRSAEVSEAAPSIPCAACGKPIPIPTDPDDRLMLNLSGIAPKHAVCPPDEPKPRKWYEAVVMVFERQTSDDEEGLPVQPDWILSPVELGAEAAARAVVEAESFAAAVPGLSDKLSESWGRIGEKAAFSDRPPIVP